MPARISPESVAEIIRLNEQGFTHLEIRARLGIGHTTICNALKKHHERVYEALVESHVAERGRQLKWLHKMFRECWEEWNRSKGQQTTKKVSSEKNLLPGTKNQTSTIERSEIQIKDGLGNPAYVDRMNAILGAIREVLMLDKTPRRDEEANPGAGDHDVTKALEDLERIEQAMRQSGGLPAKPQGQGQASRHDDDDDDDQDDDDR